MERLDLRKELKRFYSPSAKKAEIVEVPEFQFVTLSGCIEPGAEPGNSPGFAQALEVLYSVSYTLKFMTKLRKEDPVDYPVMALEALWWAKDGEFSMDRKDDWCWQAMILQPDLIARAMFEEGLAQLRKKRGDNPILAQLKLERFQEALSVQILHVGPYDTEPATVAKMDAFASGAAIGWWDDITRFYLGDPRRTAPEKLKTVLRHPIERIDA